MSVINVPEYRTEAGVHQNPAVAAFVSTNCDGGEQGLINKKFVEVYIHWDAGLTQWVEDPVYVAGQSIVALKVFNLCNDTFSYINYPQSDYRLAVLCCRNEQAVDDVFTEEFSPEFA